MKNLTPQPVENNFEDFHSNMRRKFAYAKKILNNIRNKIKENSEF